jgi:hypothetical protein
VEHLLTETLIDRELSHVFLLREDRSCQDYLFQKSEISGLFHIQLEAFRGLLTGTQGTAAAIGVEWKGVLDDAEDNGAGGGKSQPDIAINGAELTEARADIVLSEAESRDGQAPSLQTVHREVTLADLVPHPAAYYRFVLEEMDKFLAEKR